MIDSRFEPNSEVSRASGWVKRRWKCPFTASSSFTVPPDDVREAFPLASQLVPVMSAPILMVKMGQRELFSCCEIMFDRGMPTTTMAPSPPGIFLKAREKMYITIVFPAPVGIIQRRS